MGSEENLRYTHFPPFPCLCNCKFIIILVNCYPPQCQIRLGSEGSNYKNERNYPTIDVTCDPNSTLFFSTFLPLFLKGGKIPLRHYNFHGNTFRTSMLHRPMTQEAQPSIQNIGRPISFLKNMPFFRSSLFVLLLPNYYIPVHVLFPSPRHALCRGV